jgi:hypothetical protein
VQWNADLRRGLDGFRFLALEVLQPAAFPVIEARGGTVTRSRGGKSYRDQRVLV